VRRGAIKGLCGQLCGRPGHSRADISILVKNVLGLHDNDDADARAMRQGPVEPPHFTFDPTTRQAMGLGKR